MPLFGRDPQLGALRSAWQSAIDGHGGLILIEGSLGMGRTTLLETLMSEAEGARVLRARATPLDRDLPYSVVALAIGDALRAATAEQRTKWTRGLGDLGGLFPDVVDRPCAERRPSPRQGTLAGRADHAGRAGMSPRPDPAR